MLAGLRFSKLFEQPVLIASEHHGIGARGALAAGFDRLGTTILVTKPPVTTAWRVLLSATVELLADRDWNPAGNSGKRLGYAQTSGQVRRSSSAFPADGTCLAVRFPDRSVRVRTPIVQRSRPRVVKRPAPCE